MKSGWHNLQGKPGDIKRQFHECSSRSPVGLVCTEELSLSLHRRPDVFVALDVFLAPVHNANVTCEVWSATYRVTGQISVERLSIVMLYVHMHTTASDDSHNRWHWRAQQWWNNVYFRKKQYTYSQHMCCSQRNIFVKFSRAVCLSPVSIHVRTIAQLKWTKIEVPPPPQKQRWDLSGNLISTYTLGNTTFDYNLRKYICMYIVHTCATYLAHTVDFTSRGILIWGL